MDELLMELLSLSEDEYRDLISHYREKIILSVREFEKLITEEVKEKTKSIRSELESYKDMESLMQYCENCQQRFKFPQFQRNEIPHYERLNRCLGRINSCFFLFSQTVGVTLDVKCNRMM